MKYRMELHTLKNRIHHDFTDIREVVEITERHLKAEIERLEVLVKKEINEIFGEEDREFIIGWYADEFVRLDKVFPNIQRRALFMALMCFLEADLILACEICSQIPTLELDNHNRIILKKGSVEMALHGIKLFFSRLLDEIERNRLPNNKNDSSL